MDSNQTFQIQSQLNCDQPSNHSQQTGSMKCEHKDISDFDEVCKMKRRKLDLTQRNSMVPSKYIYSGGLIETEL